MTHLTEFDGEVNECVSSFRCRHLCIVLECSAVVRVYIIIMVMIYLCYTVETSGLCQPTEKEVPEVTQMGVVKRYR
eukprot:gene1164-686_t